MNSKFITPLAAVVLLAAAIGLYVIDTMTVRGSIIMVSFSCIFFFLGRAWGKGSFYSLVKGKKYRYFGNSKNLLFLEEEIEEVYPVNSPYGSPVPGSFDYGTQVEITKDLDLVVVKKKKLRLFLGTVFSRNLKKNDFCIAKKIDGVFGVQKC